MRKFEWERKPSKNQPTSKENITIIRALNNFGRVPEQHELLDEIEKLQQELQRKDNEIKQLREDIVNHIKIASEYKEQMIIKDNIINELKQNKRDYERENILEMKLHILDNNWNELKEFIQNELNNNVDKEKSFSGYQCKIILDKIKELENSGSDE